MNIKVNTYNNNIDIIISARCFTRTIDDIKDFTYTENLKDLLESIEYEVGNLTDNEKETIKNKTMIFFNLYSRE